MRIQELGSEEGCYGAEDWHRNASLGVVESTLEKYPRSFIITIPRHPTWEVPSFVASIPRPSSSLSASHAHLITGRTWRPPKAQAQLLLSPGAPPASLSPRQASPLQCRVVTSCDYDDLDKVPTVDLAPSAPDASDDAASAAAASTTIASDMAALLPWLGVLLFSQWTKPRSRLSRRRGSGCQLLQTAPPYHTENLAPCGNNGPCCWPRPRLTRRQCCNYSSGKPKPNCSINHGCTDGTGPRPSFEPV